jgi:hypothetical protein
MMAAMTLKRALAWTGIAVVLGLVFAAYLRPSMMAEMANWLWNCF